MGSLTIGLTGGPATGKTTVAELLLKSGAAVISADRIGHELLERNRRVRQALKKLLGDGIFGSGGIPDRGKIGRKVFADPAILKRFNAIMHPPLLRELKRRINRLKRQKSSGIIIVEAALIFEWGIADWFDYLISVDAPMKLRLSRCAESAVSSRQLRKRIKAQMPQKDKNALADWIINNDGDIGKLKKSVRKVVREIRKSEVGRR